ncbi:MAG TPA: carboxypeptidase-like regulatory domain-containing protein [Longimicrobium sp.]|nr:carboxypeptidase-like regulatory domain-containing protein [Longimicrobium sp.]
MSDAHGGAAPGPGAVVRGEVRGPDGRPVAGARVVITSSPVPVPEIAAVTDAAGRFALGAPAPGEYAFTAHADDESAGTATGAVRVPPPAGGAPPPAPAAHSVHDDDDADMSSDDPLPSVPLGPPAEIHVVLTLDPRAGGER